MKRQLLTLVMAGAAMVSALAVPARRGFIEKIGPDGEPIMAQRVGDEFGHYWVDADGRKLIDGDDNRLMLADDALIDQLTLRRAMRFEARNAERTALSAAAKARSNAAARVPGQIGRYPGTTFPCTGKQKAIVVLVEYQDVGFTISSDAATVNAYFHDMLNKDGFSQYNGTGSVHEYFIDSSNGAFDCDFDVYGPVTLANNMSYYGGNDRWGDDQAPWEMVIEACQALDSEVDFSEYDRDGDGVIDNVYVIYAGKGEASYGSADTVWPHSWNIGSTGLNKNYTFDGVKLDSYGCSNEWESNAPDGIGTFVHEFSHVLGLPDLYHTTDAYAYYTPGSWSVLDYGPYNNNGRTPPAYSSFERNAMGWIELTELTADDGDVMLSDINYANEAFSITNPTNSQEFYLIESRNQAGWDKYLPSTGMLIWHVDYNYTAWYNNEVNNTQSHQYVDLIEADGKASKSTRTAGDCFPGSSKKTSYSPEWWNGNSVGIDLSDIALTSDGGVMFTVSANVASGNNTGDEVGGDYYTVSDVVSGNASGTGNVRGYIVGWTDNWSAKGVHLSASGCKLTTNVVLADDPDETDIDCMIPVQLPQGDVRDDVNIKENPSNLGRYIEFTGTFATYFTVPGVKECTAYRFIDKDAEENPDEGDENNDENHTSIYEITPATIDPAAPVYDLSGRRVLNPARHGIYVQGGRKFIL